MSYGEKIRNALLFARHSGAVWWYLGYTVALAALALVLLLALLFGAGIRDAASMLASPAKMALAALFAIVFVVFAALAGNGVNGAVIQNAVDGGPMKPSWERFRPKFWTLLFASIGVAVFSAVISSVFSTLASAAPGGPWHWLLFGLNMAASLALGAAFLFFPYSVVISGRGILQAPAHSARLLMEKPVGVILAFLVMLLATIGLYLAAFTVLGLLAVLVMAIAGFSMATLLAWAAPLLAVAIPLVLVAHFFIEAFQHHLLAHLFLDLDSAKKAVARPAGAKKTVARKKKPAKGRKGRARP